MEGPIPVWIPTPEGIRDTNLATFMASFQVGWLESWEHCCSAVQQRFALVYSEHKSLDYDPGQQGMESEIGRRSCA